MTLPSPRYFRMAQRLHLRGGAVAAALLADHRAAGGREAEWTAPASARGQQTASPSGVAEGTADDVASIAAMSQQPGFPGIGYAQ